MRMEDAALREHARQLRRIADDLDPTEATKVTLVGNPQADALVEDRRSDREQYNGYVLSGLDLKRRTARYLAEYPERQKGDVMSLAMDLWLAARGY
jgi:hypothetical protein